MQRTALNHKIKLQNEYGRLNSSDRSVNICFLQDSHLFLTSSASSFNIGRNIFFYTYKLIIIWNSIKLFHSGYVRRAFSTFIGACVYILPAVSSNVISKKHARYMSNNMNVMNKNKELKIKLILYTVTISEIPRSTVLD